MANPESLKMNALFALSAARPSGLTGNQSPENSPPPRCLNAVSMCGSGVAAETLITLLLSLQPEGAAEILTRFPQMSAIQGAIAEIHSINPTAAAEAYWIGNQFSRLPSNDSTSAILLKHLTKSYPAPPRGGPGLADRIHRLFTAGSVLIGHHNFIVTALGLDDFWDQPPNHILARLNFCWIRGGRVEEVLGLGRLKATVFRLIADGNQFKLSESNPEYINFDPRLITPHPGDQIAFHRQFAVTTLSPEQQQQLEFWFGEIASRFKPATLADRSGSQSQ